MSWRKASLFLLPCLLSTALSSQVIQGTVQDESGAKLAFATIVATDVKEAEVIAFTSSNEAGIYNLNIKTTFDSIRLSARMVGYQSAVFDIAVKSLPRSLDITLVTATFQEIVVRGKTPPVIARKDTIEYNAASFSDSTEITIEDLLKKLPGVRIDETGIITYNGKLVEKVMIDGDDLFNQNYPIATRNIRADLISKVQVIDRFQENPIMKGIMESDQLIMNLKIKPDRKLRLSGSTELGSGYGDDWKAKLHCNLFSLSSKNKVYLIGDANNTGYNGLSDIEWTAKGGFQGFGKQNQLPANPLQPDDIIPLPLIENAGLPPVYSQNNRSAFAYIGMVLPTSEQFKTKISIWAGSSKIRQNSGTETSYLLANDRIDIVERKNIVSTKKIIHGQSESEYFSKDKRRSFRSFLSIDSKPIDFQLDLERDQPHYPESRINTPQRQRILDLYGAVELTLKSSETSAIQLIGKTAWRQNQSGLHPEAPWYSQMFALDSTYRFLHQYAYQQQSTSIAMGRYIINARSIKTQVESGIEWNTSILNSAVRLENAEHMLWSPGPNFQDSLRYLTPEYFLNLSAVKTWEKLSLRTKLYSSYRSNRLERLSESLSKSGWLALEPRIDLQYAPGNRSTLNTYYAYIQENPTVSELHPGNIFTTYQTVHQGLPDTRNLPGNQAGITYRYNHSVRRFSWNISAGLSQKSDRFGSGFTIQPFFQFQKTLRPVALKAYTLDAAMDRYIHRIRSRFALGFNYSFLQESGKLNSELLTHFNQNLYTANVEYGTAFDTWINMVLAVRRSEIIGKTLSVASENQTVNWFSTLQLSIKPGKTFNAKVYLHQVRNRVPFQTGSKVAYASDAVAYLHLKKWRSVIEFSALNLFGTQRFEQAYSDAFSKSVYYVAATRRFFLFSWEFSF